MPTLDELLMQTRLLTPEQLVNARKEAVQRQQRLAPTIIDLGLVDDRRFAKWISEAARVPMVDALSSAAVEPLARRIPRAVAREHEVIPLALEGRSITIATVDPLDIASLDAIRAATRMDVRPLVGVLGQIRHAVARFYPEDTIEPKRDDESLGSSTRVVRREKSPPPPPEAQSRSQLDRIEQSLRDMRKSIDALRERIEAIDETLEHLVSRKG
jgi:type IV pilus assembly protein PilB